MTSQKSWSIEGIIHGIGLLLITVVYTIYMRLAIQLYNVDPLIFTGIGLMTGAFVIMLLAGPGRLGKETLFSPATWLYSILLIVTYAADMLVMQYVTATESALLFNLSVPYAMLIAWLWMKRKPDRGDNIGLLFILISLGIVLYIQPAHLVGAIFVFALVNAVADASRLFIAETHREAQIAHQHGALRDKARVMGFVTFAASLSFLVILLTLSLYFNHGPLPSWSGLSVPALEKFAHPGTIFSGIIFGITVVSLIRYFMWSAAYHLKAESVATLVAFMPGLVLIFEWLISIAFNLDFNTAAFEGERGSLLLLATLLMCLGAGVQAFSKKTVMVDSNYSDLGKKLLRGEDNSLASGFSPNAKDDYDAVVITLEQCEHDEALAARLLDVPLHALQAVHRGRGKQAFHPSLSPRVARHFRQHVALADPLTGLANRMSFMTQLSDLLNARQKVALLFIDLNHFKPINDTYGHDAGDSVLKTVAQRLLHLSPAQARVGRLGGDEFVIALTGPALKHAQTLATHITQALAEPILLTSDLPHVTISASVGLALSTPNSTAPNLIKSADANMYQLKKGR